MKKIIFRFTLIVGIIAVVGACKKSDDSTTAATAACTAVSACSSTASGTITGIDNRSLSGTYDMFLKFRAYIGGVDNDTGCTSSSTILSAYSSNFAEGAASGTIQKVVTSSSTFAVVYKSYSDTACSSEISSLVIGYSDVTVGDNVSGLTPDTGSDDLGTTATKVTYKDSCMKGKGTTDAGTTWLNSYTSGATWTTGEELTCSGSGETRYAIWHADNSSKILGPGGSMDNFTKSVWDEMSSSSAYPSDWCTGGDSCSDSYQSMYEL